MKLSYSPLCDCSSRITPRKLLSVCSKDTGVCTQAPTGAGAEAGGATEERGESQIGLRAYRMLLLACVSPGLWGSATIQVTGGVLPFIFKSALLLLLYLFLKQKKCFFAITIFIFKVSLIVIEIPFFIIYLILSF